MGNFELIYPTIQKYEGYYSNVITDKGGETYAGITRVNNPNWDGWKIVDSYKFKFPNNKIPYNYKIPDQALDKLVKELTYQYFLRSGAAQINNNGIATIVAHLYFNSSDGIKYVIQRAVNLIGGNIKLDNTLGTESITAINSANQTKLYDKIKELYLKYYIDLGNKEPANKAGWINRVNYVIQKANGWININNGPIALFLLAGALFLIFKK